VSHRVNGKHPSIKFDGQYNTIEQDTSGALVLGKSMHCDVLYFYHLCVHCWNVCHH